MYEDEDNQQPPIRSSPYMSPIHQYGSSIIFLTNPQAELHKIELMYRGLRENSKGEVIDTGKPMMNTYGVNSIIGTLQSVVNQITVMSNLSKGDIPVLMEFLGDTLAKDLMVNCKAYDIKSHAARDKIYFTALSTAYITMKRAFEEGDRRFWKGSVQEIHSRIESQKQKGNILSTLNPWKKNS